MLRAALAAALGAAALAGTAPRPLLVVLPWVDGIGQTVTRVDRATLIATGKPIVLGEYHASWAVSPDRRHIAFGISAPGRSGRIGVRIVDLRRWTVSAHVETGIAGSVLWWPSARRLIAGLPSCGCIRQQTGFVVADPLTGRVITHVHFPGSLELFGSRHALAAGRLALLLDDRNAAAPAPSAVALISADGSFRIHPLERVLLGPSSSASASVVGVGGHIVVLGSGVAADLDPLTGAVEYHDLPVAVGDRVESVALGDSVFVAAGGKLSVLDTSTWQPRELGTAEWLEPAGTLAVSWTRGARGVRAYRGDGSLALAVLDGEKIAHVAVSGVSAYVTTWTRVVRVDLRTGRVFAAPLRGAAQVIDPY